MFAVSDASVVWILEVLMRWQYNILTDVQMYRQISADHNAMWWILFSKWTLKMKSNMKKYILVFSILLFLYVKVEVYSSVFLPFNRLIGLK